MPIPRWVTRSNKRFLNPVMLRVATGVGPMAVVRHVGRRSGRTYRTPVFAFAYREGGRVEDLRRVTGDEGLRILPGWTSAVLRRTGVDEFRTGRLLRASTATSA